MNKELQRDLGIAATSFIEYHKNKISSGSHKYREYWLMAQTELLAVFQEAFVKHKDKHAFDRRGRRGKNEFVKKKGDNQNRRHENRNAKNNRSFSFKKKLNKKNKGFKKKFFNKKKRFLGKKKF